MKSQLFEQDKMEKEGWFAIGRGSGESFQMLFTGDGFVVVQPSEAPRTAYTWVTILRRQN